VLQGVPHGSGLQRYLDFDQRYYLPDDILYKVDRISMAHSLEVRPPFLDPRIVDFAARLPEHFKLRGSKSKYVLRQLMKDRLPATVLRRPKIGFDIPVHEWFRGVLRPMLLDTLSQKAVSDSRLFRWPAVEHLLREHLHRRANFGYHLWGLMTLLIWMRRWKVELASDEIKAPPPLLESLETVGQL
jgi:asparagine synthase (glutamine-hydrolysing)